MARGLLTPWRMFNLFASYEAIHSKSLPRWVTQHAAMCATCAAAITVALAPAGCGGQDTVDTFSTQNPIDPAELDDTAPPVTPYDESLTYRGRLNGTENHSAERFRFDVAAYADGDERAKAELLYPSHAQWLQIHDASRYNWSAIPSVQTIGTYVKQLDDTIYAGVERAVQDGLSPTLEPKRKVLTGALDDLVANRSAAGDMALVHIAAALRLGGDPVSVPSELEDSVQQSMNTFLARQEDSKPIGFYTWSDELKQIWQQDRLLQQPLPTSAASCALAAAIAADPAREQAYLQLLDLYSRLTNPLRTSLRKMLDSADDVSCGSLEPEAFLGRSGTPEVALFEALYPGGVPEDADLMDDLVTGIRNGTVDLSPGPDDGWYQHQLFALETLLVTDRSEERAKIAFMTRYKKRLREAFESMLVQHRETHVKQADTASLSGPAAPDTPHFRVEPLATVYVRHARSYVFLEAALDAVMGDGFLDLAVPVGANGSEPTTTLRTRIHQARDRFFGLYVLSCQDIGLMPRLDQPGDPALTAAWNLADDADAWLLQLPTDPYASNDVRVIVPIATLGAGRWKYWAVIGVRSTLAGYSTIHGSDVSPPKPDQEARVWLPTEQFIEVTSSGAPLTREEFRALCDQEKTAEAIQSAIESR